MAAQTRRRKIGPQTEKKTQADNYPGLNDRERGGNSGKNNELETFQFAFFFLSQGKHAMVVKKGSNLE